MNRLPMDSTGPDDNHKPENSHNSKDGHRDQSIYGEPSEQNAGGLLTGCVLASSPSFSDPDLDHSVCLIIEQNDEVTVGVFLNRPIMVDPKPFWNLLMDEGTIEAKSGGHFNFGGPNNGPILAIHSNSELAEGGNDQGVYLSAQAEILKKLAVVESEHLRWVIGNATWEKGELEREIIEGRWVVVPTAPSLVFADEKEMWSQAMKIHGKELLRSFLGTRELPIDPRSN